jgi:hypothetical protein
MTHHHAHSGTVTADSGGAWRALSDADIAAAAQAFVGREVLQVWLRVC